MAAHAGRPAEGKAAAEPVQGQDRRARTGRQMQQELMALYKEHNVNPFGSCLPLRVPDPVFIAPELGPAVPHPSRTATRRSSGISNIFAKLNQIGGAPGVHPHRPLRAARCWPRRCSSRSSPTGSRSTCCAGDADHLRSLRPQGFSTGVVIYWITSNFWTIGQQGMIKQHDGPPLPAGRCKTSGGGGSKGPARAAKGGTGGDKGSRGRQGRPGGDKGGGKPVGESTNVPTTAARRRPAAVPAGGRRSSQRRGGRKR